MIGEKEIERLVAAKNKEMKKFCKNKNPLANCVWCKCLGKRYTGASPAWINRHGEQVFQVFSDYEFECGAKIGGNFEFMTANGSQDVRKI